MSAGNKHPIGAASPEPPRQPETAERERSFAAPTGWATCADCGQPIKSPQAGHRRWEHGGKYGHIGYVNVHHRCPPNTELTDRRGAGSVKCLVMPRFNFGKSNDGLVHLVSALNGEYTLCGNAFDGDVDGQTNDPHAWTDTKHGPVTCPECSREIENCRGVRTRHNH